MLPVKQVQFKSLMCDYSGVSMVTRRGFRGGSVGKESAAVQEMEADVHLISGSGRSSEGHDNPLQCSCLENPRHEGAWCAAIFGVTQSWTRLKRLSSSSSSKVTLDASGYVYYISQYTPFLFKSFWIGASSWERSSVQAQSYQIFTIANMV